MMIKKINIIKYGKIVVNGNGELNLLEKIVLSESDIYIQTK